MEELVSLLLTSGPDQRHPIKARAPHDRLRRLAALTGCRWPARAGQAGKAIWERGRSRCHNDGGRSVTSLSLRPFFWRRSGATLQSWLALANPEHRISSLRMRCPAISTTMHGRRLAALAGWRSRQGTIKARAGAASPSLTAPKRNENPASDRLQNRSFARYTCATPASPWQKLHST